MTTWDDNLPLPWPTDDEAADIVKTLAAFEVELDVDAVRLLISEARLAHQRCLSAWMRKYDPEHKAPRSSGPYSAWENTGRGNPGLFRDGSGIPKPPLVAVYFLCNAWYRREVKKPFWPDFRARHIGDDYKGLEKYEWINPPALFFFLVAQAAVTDFAYTIERCAKVHNLYYKKLNTKIP